MSAVWEEWRGNTVSRKEKKILSWHSKLRSLMGVILFLWFPAILWSPLQQYEAQRQLAEMRGTKRVGVYKKENRERCGTAELHCRSRNRYSLLSECTVRWPDGVCREIDWTHWMQLHCYFTVRVLHPWVLRHLPLSQGDDSITPWFFWVGLCAHQLMSRKSFLIHKNLVWLNDFQPIVAARPTQQTRKRATGVTCRHVI